MVPSVMSLSSIVRVSDGVIRESTYPLNRWSGGVFAGILYSAIQVIMNSVPIIDFNDLIGEVEAIDRWQGFQNSGLRFCLISKKFHRRRSLAGW